MKEFNEFYQGSQEWLNAKLGKIGGSKLKKVFAANNLDLIDELLAEVGSGLQEEVFFNSAMKRGVEIEPIARDLFSEIHDIEIDEIGLCVSDEFPNNVCSPDGFSEDRKIGIEIKCPSTKKHVQYIRQGGVPNDYKYQVLNYFLINEKCEKVYFISYDDRYRPKPYFEVLVNRCDVEHELTEIRTQLAKFWTKFDKYAEQIMIDIFKKEFAYCNKLLT